MPLNDEGLFTVPGLHSRYVRLANGSRAHYMTSGETGPAVVLLHGGIPGSSGLAGWRFMAPFLGANGFRVYCPDQPGFGLADTRPEFWPTQGTLTHVEFLEQFVQALGIDRFFLAGNSLGTYNSAHYITRYPHRIIRFALIAGGLGALVPQSLARPRDMISWDGDPETMRRMMKLIIKHYDEISDDLIDARVHCANLQQDSWNEYWRNFALGGLDKNIRIALTTKDRFGKLNIPGVYLYGKDDEILPVELAADQEDALPHVQFFYPDDCGHQGQTDQPKLFNQLFLEFFRDGIVSRETADRAGVSTRRPAIPTIVAPA